MAYLDAASDRHERDAEARYMSAVEATRAGTIFAHDERAHARWSGRRNRASSSLHPAGLEGAALETAVRAFARTNPEYVVVGG